MPRPEADEIKDRSSDQSTYYFVDGWSRVSQESNSTNSYLLDIRTARNAGQNDAGGVLPGLDLGAGSSRSAGPLDDARRPSRAEPASIAGLARGRGFAGGRDSRRAPTTDNQRPAATGDVGGGTATTRDRDGRNQLEDKRTGRDNDFQAVLKQAAGGGEVSDKAAEEIGKALDAGDLDKAQRALEREELKNAAELAKTAIGLDDPSILPRPSRLASTTDNTSKTGAEGRVKTKSPEGNPAEPSLLADLIITTRPFDPAADNSDPQAFTTLESPQTTQPGAQERSSLDGPTGKISERSLDFRVAEDVIDRTAGSPLEALSGILEPEAKEPGQIIDPLALIEPVILGDKPGSGKASAALVVEPIASPFATGDTTGSGFVSPFESTDGEASFDGLFPECEAPPTDVLNAGHDLYDAAPIDPQSTSFEECEAPPVYGNESKEPQILDPLADLEPINLGSKPFSGEARPEPMLVITEPAGSSLPGIEIVETVQLPKLAFLPESTELQKSGGAPQAELRSPRQTVFLPDNFKVMVEDDTTAGSVKPSAISSFDFDNIILLNPKPQTTKTLPFSGVQATNVRADSSKEGTRTNPGIQTQLF